MATERRLLRTLIDNVPDYLYAKDTSGRFVLANLALAHSFGKATPEEILGKSDRDFHPPDLAAQYAADEQAVLASRQPLINHEEIVIGPGGNKLWLLTTKVPVFGPQGQAIGLVGIGRDITGRRLAESALRESEEKFRSYIERAPVAVLVSDEDGRFTDCNPAAVALLGYDAPTLKGMAVPSLHPEDDGASLSQAMETLARTGHVEGEFRMKRQDGRIIWVSLTVGRIGPGRALGYCLDITHRREAEDRLRKLARAVEQSPVSIIITDRAGNIEFVNPKFTEMTGYAPEEVLGKNPRLLKSGETSVTEYRQLWETITAGKEWRGEFHNKRKDGTLYWETASISAVRGASGEITHFIAVKEDTTEKKQLECQRCQKNPRASGAISHLCVRPCLASAVAGELGARIWPLTSFTS